MDNPTIIITFHRDTLEVDVDAPELALDVVINFLQRAMRQCENAEKIVVAQQVNAAVRASAENAMMDQERTRKVLSRIKLQ